MRVGLLALSVIAVVPVAALGQAPAPGPSAQAPTASSSATGDASAVVRALELRRFELLAKGDYDALAALLADDLVYTHSDTRVDDKRSYLAPLRAGTTRYVECVPSEVTVRVFGDTAILTGRVLLRAVVAQEERINNLRFTDVWLRRAGQWQLVAWQATRLP